VEEVAFGATEPAPEEYVIYNCKHVQWDVALACCIASIEGFRKSTNLTESGASFELWCATRNKGFSSNNPANFWETHKKKCAVSVVGQVLERGAPL
jgi:hypothetical protein